MSRAEFQAVYDAEEQQCRQAVIAWRRPGGFECPRRHYVFPYLTEFQYRLNRRFDLLLN